MTQSAIMTLRLIRPNPAPIVNIKGITSNLPATPVTLKFKISINATFDKVK